MGATEKVSESLQILEVFFEGNIAEFDNINQILAYNLNEGAFSTAVEALEEIYGEAIADSLVRIISLSNTAIKIINEGKFNYSKEYMNLIFKFKKAVLRVRSYEEHGAETLIKISDNKSIGSLFYSLQTADSSIHQIRIPHENQLNIVYYFINVLNNYINESHDLDLNAIEDFTNDLLSLSEVLGTLENTLIDKKVELSSYAD